MWTVAFWKAAAERAVRAFAAALASIMTADGFGLLDADWTARLTAAAMAGLISLLLSVAASQVAPTGYAGPSLLGTEKLPKEHKQPHA